MKWQKVGDKMLAGCSPKQLCLSLVNINSKMSGYMIYFNISYNIGKLYCNAL